MFMHVICNNLYFYTFDKYWSFSIFWFHLNCYISDCMCFCHISFIIHYFSTSRDNKQGPDPLTMLYSSCNDVFNSLTLSLIKKVVHMCLCSLQVKLSSLNLDDHARKKMIKLSEERYCKNTDTLTITTDRCVVWYIFCVWFLSSLTLKGSVCVIVVARWDSRIMITPCTSSPCFTTSPGWVCSPDTLTCVCVRFQLLCFMSCHVQVCKVQCLRSYLHSRAGTGTFHDNYQEIRRSKLAWNKTFCIKKINPVDVKIVVRRQQ